MTSADLARRLRLTVITDPGAPGGVAATVLAALGAGTGTIQLRWKGGEAREIVELGRELRKSTLAHGALLIVNDRADIAMAIGADGVHLGDDDLPLPVARRIAPPGFVIGKSADTAEEGAAAEAAGADYVGIGPIHPTGTKLDTGAVIGLHGVAAARERLRIPLVGIGGIHAARARAVIEAGADGIAVVGAVMLADDPAAAAAALIREIEAGGRGGRGDR